MKKILISSLFILIGVLFLNVKSTNAQVGSMMGYGGFSSVHGLLAGVTWITLIIFLVVGTYFFIKQAGKK